MNASGAEGLRSVYRQSSRSVNSQPNGYPIAARDGEATLNSFVTLFHKMP